MNIIIRKDIFELKENEDSTPIKDKEIEEYEKLISEKIDKLKEDISVEDIERFLGYSDDGNKGIKLRSYQQIAKDNAEQIYEKNKFAAVIVPTGGGKSYIAISEILEQEKINEEINKKRIAEGKPPKKMIYLAPQNEILEQIKDDIINNVHGKKNTFNRSKEEIIKEIFPNLEFATYSSLISNRGKELIKDKYSFMVLDELHRTGANKWKKKLYELFDNQDDDLKVLGITATPRRDFDGKDMSREIAEKLGYTNKETAEGKHIAINISLVNAIRMGLVVNPKLVLCEYKLIEDERFKQLRKDILNISDEDLQKEKLEEYERIRRNLEKVGGISEILQENVKQGGKYIVFLPMFNGIEDEDGNQIGILTGKEKIKEYERKLLKYFENSQIKPKFHSMLGEYGDKENAKRLEKFKNANSEETQFMLVINKANEGFHSKGLNGMIWFRAMDESSIILYYQQFGRPIRSENPEEPTKDEDRPIIIDLVNNTIKVKWNSKIQPEDDIELLRVIEKWARMRNGKLPNINSNDKEEYSYAVALKKIQEKYIKYKTGDFDKLSEKQICEIKTILKVGEKINLWDIELPARINAKTEKNNENKCEQVVGEYIVKGILRDFIELENEVKFHKKHKRVKEFIGKLEKLKLLNIDVSKIRRRDTILTLAEKQGVTPEKLKQIGLNPDEKIGNIKTNIGVNYRKEEDYLSEEEIIELQQLGINLEVINRDVVEEFIDEISILKEEGIDVSNIIIEDNILSLIEKQGISREKLNQLEIDMQDNIGYKKRYIQKKFKENHEFISAEQLKELKDMGIDFEQNKKNKAETFIDDLEKLQEIGVDVSKILMADTIFTLAQKQGISEERILSIGLNPSSKIGETKRYLGKKYRKDKSFLSGEEIKKINDLGISFELKNNSAVEDFIENLEKLQQIGLDTSKILTSDTISSFIEREGGSELNGLNPDEKIGDARHYIISQYRKKKEYLTESQKEKLNSLGVKLERGVSKKDIVKATIGVDRDLCDLVDKKIEQDLEKTKKSKTIR